jgi:hypothetical protein
MRIVIKPINMRMVPNLILEQGVEKYLGGEIIGIIA